MGKRVLAYAELIVSQTSNKLSIPITIVQCLWRFPGSFTSDSVLIKLVRENITFLYFRTVYFCRFSNVVFVSWFCLLRQPLEPESRNAPRHNVTPVREAATRKTNHDFAWVSGTGIRRVGLSYQPFEERWKRKNHNRNIVPLHDRKLWYDEKTMRPFSEGKALKGGWSLLVLLTYNRGQA